MKYLIACAAALLGTSANAAKYLDISFDVLGAHADVTFDTTDLTQYPTSDNPDSWGADIFDNQFEFGAFPQGYLIIRGSFDLSSFDLSGSSFSYAMHSVDGYEADFLIGGYREPEVYYSYGLLYNVHIVGTDDARTPGIVITGAVTPPSPGAGVPEPASWAMMLAGFGMVGGALRSRRRAAVSFG